jgi:hypothetical protein
MPDAPYVLSATEKCEFFEILRSIRTPSCYVSNLHSRITNGKLRGLKSHDYHILLQQILHVCLRNIGDEKVVGAMVRLSRLFQRLCSKVVDKATEIPFMVDAVETLCQLEKVLPPSFFDILVHLTVHLVEELFLYGPVQTCWMYPYERYFKS